METNLSSDAFHMIIVPPVAFDFLKAMSWSNLSSLFNSQKYSPLNMVIELLRSEVKIFGSLRKTKSALVSSVIFLRLYIFRFRPSRFQDREVIDLATGTVVEEVGFSGGRTEVVKVGNIGRFVGFSCEFEGSSTMLE